MRTTRLRPTLLALMVSALLVGGGAALAAPGRSAADDPVISISGFAFQGQLTVTPGATVTVRNDDTAPHTLTAVDGSFTTEIIQPGASTTFVAPLTAGSFSITCQLHPFMTGTLVVAEAGTPTPPPLITISGFAYQGQLAVTPGATVTVRNDDTAPHTLTAVDGSFTTEIIQPGASTTFVAPLTAGDYPITCQLHLFMSGTLTVADGNIPPPSESAPPPPSESPGSIHRH